MCNKELVEVARAALDYIDALPADVVAALPAMPGFDRDWAENVIKEAGSHQQPGEMHYGVLALSSLNIPEYIKANVLADPAEHSMEDYLRWYDVREWLRPLIGEIWISQTARKLAGDE